jgi:hypothetical protein
MLQAAIGTAYSDVDQSLIIVGSFLVFLAVLLMLATYMEPRSEARPLGLMKRLTRARRPEPDS